MLSTETKYKAIYKWREKNKEKYNETCRIGSKKFYDNGGYERNKEEKIKKVLERYYFLKNNPFEKEASRLRRILI